MLNDYSKLPIALIKQFGTNAHKATCRTLDTYQCGVCPVTLRRIPPRCQIADQAAWSPAEPPGFRTVDRMTMTA